MPSPGRTLRPRGVRIRSEIAVKYSTEADATVSTV